MGKRKLTEKEISERIKYANKHTQAEFSVKFGLKSNTTRVFYSRFVKVPKKFKNMFTADQIREYAKTHTLQDAMTYFRCSYQSIYKFSAKNNIQFVRKKRSDYDRTKIEMIIYLSQKYNDITISRLLNVSRQYISMVLKNAKMGRYEGITL